ncbi:hypothetical protein D3C81_1991820 [compost metagenome]
MGTKAAGDFFPAPAQLAHAVQEGQLRRTGGFGAVEQYVVKAGQHLAEGLRQHRQSRLAGEHQQVLVTAGLTGGMRIGVHAQRLHTL